MSILDKIKSSGLFIEKSYISGSWVDSEDKIEVENPANNEIIGYVPSLSMDKVIESIASANLALRHMDKVNQKDRSSMLKKWYDLIIQNKQILAEIIVLEQGKAIREAISEVEYAASYILWYSHQALENFDYVLDKSDVFPSLFKEVRVQYKPVGITAAITPWNFPIAMIARKAGAAFAAGCPMIIKPSEYTPFSCMAFVKLAIDAGIPENSFQVVTGNAEDIGKVLLSSYDVRKISFTGSTKVGKYLVKNSGDALKKLSLELGGNAPLIIHHDADINTAINMVINGKFRNNGQSCTAVNRILVHKDIKKKLIEKLKEAISPIKVGDGFNPDNYLGSVINKVAIDRLMSLIDGCQKEGGNIVLGGRRLYDKGYFLEPTIINNVTNNMHIARTEIFGPVITVIEYSDIEEAIAMANDTEYGLAAYLCSKDQKLIEKFCLELQFGMIGVNDTRIADVRMPFGGIKNSGFGREGGKEGILEYMETRSFSLN